MGGSGGGISPRGGSAIQSINCDELRFEANLGFLEERVVQLLHVGAVLEVMLERAPHMRVVVQFEGETAGIITERLTSMVHCLELGKAYTAVVLTTDNDIVRVRVRPA